MKNAQHVIAHARTHSPLGPLLLAASEHGLCGLWFEEQKHLPPWLPVRWDDGPPSHPVLKAASDQLTAYFGGVLEAFDLPLDLRHGTPFQCAVWQAMVGAAVGRNPVGIIVPCHRVMGADGSLTGYAGGLWRKTALLRLESGPPAPVPAGTTHDLFS